MLFLAFSYSATPLVAKVGEKPSSAGDTVLTEREELTRREKDIRQALRQLKSQLSGRRLSEEIAEAEQSRSDIRDAAQVLSDLRGKIAAVRHDATRLDGWSFWLGYAEIQATLDRLNAEWPALQARASRAAVLDRKIRTLETLQARDAEIHAQIETLTAELGDVKDALASLPAGIRGEGGFSSQAVTGRDGRAITRALPGRPNAGVRGYKVDPEIARRRTLRPQGSSSVIVTLVPGAQLPQEFKKFARTNTRLQAINGQVLDLPNRIISQLEARPEVFQIHENRPIKADNYRTSFTIGARAVQRGFGLTGAGVGIAVIDSGIATWHDDLTSRSSVSYPYGDQRLAAFVDFVNGQPLPYDDQGHGSHVAGIIAGNGYNSGSKQSGIAPEASLVSLKVLDANGQGTVAGAIAALDWVLAHHAEYNIGVVNLSVGAHVQESYWTDPLTLAAKRVVDAGITVVTAAGNRGKNANGEAQSGGISAPANAPWVLTIGASSSNGTSRRDDDSMADFSSRGPTYLDWSAKPDLVAPGYGTISLADPFGLFYGSKAQYLVAGSMPTGYQPYLALSGTSMAAPVVSGTVALMLQANPSLTPNAVKAVLQYTAQENLNYNALTQGAGFLNAVGAVRLASFYATAQPGDAVPTQAMWSKHIIWGNQLVGGGLPVPFANAYAAGTTWGAALTDEGDNIVWGTSCEDCDNIVWGTNDADNIVWGTSGDLDNIVWGTDDADNIVWGTDCGGADCDNIVWGTAGDGDNIVWGTAEDGDNIVWGTSRDLDNIVWGTDEVDNIVWGTDDGDNIVWGTEGDDNIVWGTTDDGDNIVWGTDGDDNIVWGTLTSSDEIVWIGGATDVTPLTWNDVVTRLTDEEVFELLASISSPRPDASTPPSSDQAPADPAPSEPAPADGTSSLSDPAPSEPVPSAPSDPAPASSDPAPAEPAPSDPGPAPSEPAPSGDPVPSSDPLPAPSEPASSSDPAPVSTEPAPSDPTLPPADPAIPGGGF